MKAKLKHKVEGYATSIISVLNSAGYEAYIVGGAIRDLLLNRIPKDYDISTNATPEEIRSLFGRKKARIIGRRFKIVHIYIADQVVEVSTFRTRPKKPSDNRLQKKYNTPKNLIFRDNEYGTVDEDASRRDFTVNALYYDPIKDSIHDFTGHGLDDISSGVVRSIGNPKIRFEEDPVRVLRALKLVAQYDFKLTDETYDALKQSLKLLKHVTPARLSLEFEKVMLSQYCTKILTTLKEYDLLKFFLPYINSEWKTSARKRSFELLDIYKERVKEGKYRNSISISLATMILPFVEDKLGFNDPGTLWEPDHTASIQIKKTLFTTIMPHTFCKHITMACIKMVELQPLLTQGYSSELLNRRNIFHAIELLNILNLYYWHNDEITSIWENHRRKTHKNKKRRPRRRKKKPTETK
jgi:poly(A) polymerase